MIHVADDVADGQRLRRLSHIVIYLSPAPAMDSEFDGNGDEDLDFSFCDFAQDSRNHVAAGEFLNVWRHHRHHCTSLISSDWKMSLVLVVFRFDPAIRWPVFFHFLLFGQGTVPCVVAEDVGYQPFWNLSLANHGCGISFWSLL